jgi:heptosyltransferase I
MYTGVKEPSPTVRILVVRLGAMGDIIHTLPAVASLKHSLPGSHITWAVAPQWAPLLEGNVFVDRLIGVERTSLPGLLRSRKELRREPFQFAVDFQGLIKSALVASVAGPDRIFGFARSQVREKPAALFYSNYSAPTSAHVVDRNLDLARAAGASSLLYKFPLPPGESEGTLPGRDFVLACPLAGWKAKQWPLEFYSQLAGRLEREMGLALVVNGPPSSAGVLAGIPGAVAHTSGLPGLIYATRKAKAVVGVDSGPLHLAAALEKPGVAIFGPTDPSRNGPYRSSIEVLRSPAAETSYKRGAEIEGSMRAIPVERVLAVLEAQLHSRPTAAHPF